MRQTLLLALLVAGGAWWAAGRLAVHGWAAVPPLSLDGYRHEKLPTGTDDSASLKEINGACYVCHANYRSEPLVLSHAKHRVGCVECHGQSLPHQVDEFHRTPPEKMYAAHNIDQMCAKCHQEHDVPARKVVQRWQQRCASKVDPGQTVCTDCHFEHRLASRSVLWDRKTGKLMLYKNHPGANPGSAK